MKPETSCKYVLYTVEFVYNGFVCNVNSPMTLHFVRSRKFAWNNSSLYRKQTCWKDHQSEAARSKIKDHNQSKLIISQLTGLKTAILEH